MQNKNRFLFFSLAGILMALLLSVASNPASGDGNPGSRLNKTKTIQSMGILSQAGDSFNCLDLLREVANRAGLKGDETYAMDSSDKGRNYTHCDLQLAKKIDERDTTGYYYYNSSRLIILSSPEDPEIMRGGDFIQRTKMTFHGFPALLETSDPVEEHGKSFHWYIPEHKLVFYLDVFGYSFYSDANGTTQRTYPVADWMQVAETFYAVAYNRLPELNLPPPDPDQILPATPEEILPVDPGEVVPDQPELPTDETVPAETGGIFGIPVPVILGSLGVPVAGAVAGAALATILSLIGAHPVPGIAASGDVPKMGATNNQDLYWSERPWDEAGPGYVSKEEYERTKDMLQQGCKWTNGGWQTPGEIRQSDQWQQNNRDAVAREEAEWRAKMEAERQALEQNKAELKKTADELQAASNMLDLKDDFEAIRRELLDQNIYVANPYQGDPTLVVYGLNTLKNLAWDKTAGMLTGSHGLTCEGYVEKTYDKVIEAVSKRFPGAKVQNMIFEENSTMKTVKTWGDSFDSIIDDNHNLTKIILPDGSEWALDFHQRDAGNSPLLRPWQEARKAWKDDYMRDEFMERVRRTTQTDPKPGQ